jgi:hypothetical protein
MLTDFLLAACNQMLKINEFVRIYDCSFWLIVATVRDVTEQPRRVARTS